MIQEDKNTSPRQKFLSMVILSILMVIGVGIFITQFRFNPGVLKKDVLLQASNKDKPSPQLVSNAYFVPLPEGLQPLTESEIFDARNLSDKIDGKAELYLSSGFTRLVSQRFRDERQADLWVEAFVYDMGNNQNAFSVFSAQRREDAESLGLTQHAYRTSNALFNSTDSIGANIAEGTGRGSYPDNRRFARIARGSLFEVKHWLRRAYRRNLLSENGVLKLQKSINELTPKLSAYIRSIGDRKEKSDKTK